MTKIDPFKTNKPINLNIYNKTKRKTKNLKNTFLHEHVLRTHEEEEKQEELKYKTNIFSSFFYDVFKKDIKNYNIYKKKHNLEDTKFKIKEDFFYKIPFIIYEKDIFLFKKFRNFFDILNIKIPTEEDFKYINENKPLNLKLSLLCQLSFLQMFLYFYTKFARSLTPIKDINNVILICNIYILIFFIILIFNPLIFLSLSLFRFILIEIFAFIFNKHTQLNFYKKFYNINLEVRHEFIEKSIYKESKKKFFFIANIIKFFNLLFVIKNIFTDILKKKTFIENKNIYISNQTNNIKTKRSWFYKFNLIKLILQISKYLDKKYIKEYFTQEKYNKLITNLDILNFKINGFLYFYFKSEVEFNKDPEPLTIRKTKHLKDIAYLYFYFYLIYLGLDFGFNYGFSPTDIVLNILGVYDYIFDKLWEYFMKFYNLIVFTAIIRPIFYFCYNLLDTWYLTICSWPISILISFIINYIIHYLLLSFFYIKYFPRFFIEYLFTFYSNEEFKENIFNIHFNYFFSKLDQPTSYYKLILNYVIPFLNEFNINIDILYYIYKIFIFILILIPIYIYIKIINNIIYLQLYINIFKYLKIIFIKIKKRTIKIYTYIKNYIINNYLIKGFWTEEQYIEIIFEHITYIIFILWDHKNYFLIKKNKKDKIIFQYYKLIHKCFLFLDIFTIFFIDFFIFYLKYRIKDITSKILNLQYIYLLIYNINKLILYSIFITCFYLYLSVFIPYIQNIYLFYILKYSFKFDKFFLFLILYIYNNFEIFILLNIIIYIYLYFKNINYITYLNITKIKLKYYLYILLRNLFFYIIFIPLIPLGYIYFFLYLITKFYIYKNTKHLINKYFRYYANFQNFFILFTLIKFFSFYFILLNIYIFIYIFLLNIYIKNIIFIIIKYILIFFILNIYFYLSFLILKIFKEIKIYFNILFFDEILKIKIKKKNNNKTKIFFNFYIKQNKILLLFFLILSLHIKYFIINTLYILYINDNNLDIYNLEYEELFENLDDEDDDEDNIDN